MTTCRICKVQLAIGDNWFIHIFFQHPDILDNSETFKTLVSELHEKYMAITWLDYERDHNDNIAN